MATELQDASQTVEPSAPQPAPGAAGRLGRTLRYCTQWVVALGFVACGFFGAEVVHLAFHQSPSSPAQQQHLLAVSPAQE